MLQVCNMYAMFIPFDLFSVSEHGLRMKLLVDTMNSALLL